MSQVTNLNIAPYYDDFDASKNYRKVLFKPGFPIQSRELSTLQSILQEQIEKFGQHFFKEGSMVIPGGTIVDLSYFAVRIDPFFLNVPVKEYTKYLADNKIEIQGEISGVKATVVNRITDIESLDQFDTLYLKYTASGDDGVTKTFLDGENLITLSDIEYSNTRITANSTFARTIISDSVKTGSSASISEGIFFIRGYFVQVPSTTVILDQYTNQPSYKIGLLIEEELISASSLNSDLFDNAKGYSNETAPGADRFKMSAVLSKKLLTDNDDSDFVELIRVENGVTKEQYKNSADYNIFKDELARRTFDESGNYYIEPFSVDVRETLNNRIANRGLYFSNQITQNGNTPSDNLFTLQISEGKAYVQGYEIEKTSTTSIDLPKPRTTKSIDNVSLPIKIGNIIVVNNIYGTPQVGFSTFAHLLDKRLTSDQDRDQTGNLIGKARIYDFNQYTGTNYQLRLFDIETFTKVSLASTSPAVIGDHVEGKFSGSAGFVNAQTGTGSVLTLTDVSGEFQINEPILVNGIEVGSNIGTITDFEFTDVKAIHSDRGIGAGATSFAADLELSHSKQVFQTGAEFQITAEHAGISTVTGPSVSDFRSLIKVGDIISYSASANLTNSVPTFNQVVNVESSNFTISGIATVTGICDGGGVVSSGGASPTDIVVRVPFLRKGSNPGFLIPFKEENIASLNLLDSNYITRKIFKVTVSNNEVVLNLDSHGENLFFEPFSIVNYIATQDSNGNKAVLREPQFNFSNNNRSLTIKKIGLTGAVTVTTTVKRTSFASIEKSITRCSSLIVNRSNDTSSGVTTTSLNDGLSFSRVYGTRVQDEEISLHVPEILRVLDIFESDDDTNPEEPFFVVSSQSEGFQDNVIVGEQIIGVESGAVARVTDVDNDTKIKFVYENDKAFEVDETISLRISGIVAVISKLDSGDTSIVDNYILDDGQRQEFADYGRIIREKNATIPNRKIKIIFDHFTRSGISTNGTIESINSYNTLDYSNEIPTIDGKSASDVIDLRPRVAPYNVGVSTLSPFEFASRDFSASETESLSSNQSIVVDYSYYLGRIDRLYLTKDGIFDVDEGTPSRFPKPPEKNPEAFEIGTITLPPYLINASTDTQTSLKSHKRYTMKDINSLEHRIKTLEEYTTLSLLETDTKNLSIKDPNTGLDKFKSGFFVDNFTSHKKSSMRETRGERNFDIDREAGECRPKSTERTVSLKIETKSSKSDPVNADYAWITDFEDSNITRNAQGLTLNYDEVEFINQPFATRVENLNPYHIALYAGSIALEPSVDYWVEEIPLGTPAVFEDTSAWDAMADMYGVQDRENGGMASSFWNSHEVTWSGREEVLRRERFNVERTVDVNEEKLRRSKRPFIRRITTRNINLKFDVERTLEEKGEEREFGLEITPQYETVSLGKKVIGTEVIHNCRSRNIEVTSTRLKPNTKFYVFMDNVDITSYCVPKLLQVSMTRGTFTTGDIVESSIEVENLLGFGETPDIMFRVAKENHKTGPFNAPTETYKNEPYNKTTLSGSYSSSSTILNVDTAGLALEIEPNQLGWVRKGMTLASQNGNAEAEITDLSLITDEKGALTFSLHIPDPKVQSNPKFTTGTNTIRLTTSSTNKNNLDPGECSAEATYKASGIGEITQEQILSIKSANVERKQIGDARAVSRMRTEIERDVEVTRTTQNDTGWYDPLAQSFLVEAKYQDGLFVTGGNLYFKTKDDNVPVTVQIRTMRDGTPTTTIVPFGEMNIDPADINLSDDSTVATPFKFPTPVYLKSGKEYALTLVAPTEKYNHFITRMGEEDLILQAISNQQPYLGSLFKSQNQSTWTPSQFEDLKFTLNKAKFVTNTPSSFIFYNNKLDFGNIRKRNPVTAYSKTQRIAIKGSTSPTFVKGNELKQGTNTGRIVSIGSSVTESASGLTFEGNTGIGLTSIGSGVPGIATYIGIGASSVTGIGTGLEATIEVKDSSVNTITVTNGGSGYQVGDALVFNKIGDTGSTVRAFVDSVSNPNILIVDQVDKNFVSSDGIVHVANNGTNTTLPTSRVESVVSDPIKDGFTLEFDHRNHGMHGANNKVEIKNFKSDRKPTDISEDILFDSTSITVESDQNFGTFEGVAVGSAHTGYVQIGKEIIGYHGPVSGNVISGISERGVDSSLVSTHKAGKRKIRKYEFNGVSLRKINKVHDIDGSRDRTFNSYYVKLDDAAGNKPFTRTKTGGGHRLRVSQNIPFEAIDPRVTMINPTGTSVSARIKTTSGTSISGTEASFTDKGYEDVTLNKLNILDDPRIVASKVNEFNLLNNENSFALEVVLSSSQPDVSPMIDLNTPNIILISNLVDDQVENYREDRRSRVQGEEPNSAVYITNKINLEFPSNSLYVQFDGHKDDDSDFRVFYKLHRSDLPQKQVYNPFNLDGSPDTFIDPNVKYNAFSEYKYTAENLPQFTSFKIKVVMTSKNQANAPRFKNFRAIALRSFDVD